MDIVTCPFIYIGCQVATRLHVGGSSWISQTIAIGRRECKKSETENFVNNYLPSDTLQIRNQSHLNPLKRNEVRRGNTMRILRMR